jgi:transposase InsO family protein
VVLFEAWTPSYMKDSSVGGQIGYSELNFEAIHQFILPAAHPAVNLLIEYTHKKEGHVGVDHTLNLLRQKHWIFHGGEKVRKVIRNCRRCQHMRAPFLAQQMAPLPEARVTLGYAFEMVGLDFFGPLYVGIGKGQVLKHYGVIFTCLRTQAVHLELVEKMTSSSFIDALIQFQARRGYPREIYSDNGTNFTGAS